MVIKNKSIVSMSYTVTSGWPFGLIAGNEIAALGPQGDYYG